MSFIKDTLKTIVLPYSDLFSTKLRHLRYNYIQHVCCLSYDHYVKKKFQGLFYENWNDLMYQIITQYERIYTCTCTF